MTMNTYTHLHSHTHIYAYCMAYDRVTVTCTTSQYPDSLAYHFYNFKTHNISTLAKFLKKCQNMMQLLIGFIVKCNAFGYYFTLVELFTVINSLMQLIRTRRLKCYLNQNSNWNNLSER